MDKIAESIANNPYIVLFVEAATIIALIIAIVIPIIQKRKKRLSYSYTTNVLVNEKLSEMDELIISFKGKTINHLSVTSFKIINNGNVTIEDGDVYKGHELKIAPVSNSTQVISVKLISQSSDTVEGIVTLDNSCVNVSFQTFEVKDYISLNIYHFGDDNTEFELTGKIKEAKIISSSYESISRFRRAIIFAILASYVCSIITNSYILTLSKLGHTKGLLISLLALGLMLAICTASSIVIKNMKK